MKIRKVDGSGDWQFGKGLSDYASELMAIEQNIRSRLLSWQGDCFFALQEGIDYQNLLDKGQEQNLIEATKAVILGSYGVTGVSEVSSVLDVNRKLRVEYTVDTIYGLNFAGVVEPR